MKRIFLVFSVLIVSIYAFGQTASFIAFAPNAGSLSLGLTGVASEANAFVNYNNSSSALYSNKAIEVSLLYAKWQPDYMDNSFIGAAGYYKINDNIVVDFGYRKFGYQSYEIFDENGANKGSFEPSEMCLSFGFGYKLSEKFALAADVNYIKSEIASGADATAFAVDFGITYRFDSTFRLGAKFDNLGTKLDYGYGENSLPAHFMAGVAYDYYLNSDNKVTAMFDAGYTFSFSQFVAGIGVEYNYKQRIKPRIGYHYGDDSKGIPSFVSAGVGIEYFNISFDFAYIFAGGGDSVLNNSISFGIGYGF